MDVENGIYDMNNQSKKATFKYEKEGRFCLSVARVNILDRKITGKFCPVFNCTRGGGFTVDGYKKEISKDLSRVRNLTSSSKLFWVITINSDNIWNCEYVSKLKVIVNKGDFF